jgi:hypothetical protein
MEYFKLFFYLLKIENKYDKENKFFKIENGHDKENKLKILNNSLALDVTERVCKELFKENVSRSMFNRDQCVGVLIVGFILVK